MLLLKRSTPTAPPPKPPIVPANPPVPRDRIAFTWTGSDGVAWDMVNGPVTIARGASGFGIPKPTHWTTEAASIDGADWQGMRTPPRPFFMPVHVRAVNYDQIATERAFFAGLDPRGEGVLRATYPDGRWREIRLRYDEGAEGEYDIDPILLRYAAYPLRFVANDPFWRGAPVVTTFVNVGTSFQFFPGPPFRIGNSNTLDLSQVSNPGDQDAYPLWTITGPCDSFSVGVGEATVNGTVTLAAGQSITIDMDPRALTVVDNTGADRWSVLTDAEFAPIPGNTTADLTTSLTAAGTGSSVSLAFTPRYRRAW